MENTMATTMKTFMDKILAEAPKEVMLGDSLVTNPEGIVQVQLSLVNGAVMAGGLSKTGIDNLYQLRSPVRQGDARTGKVILLDTFFSAEAVFSVAMPMSQQETSGIVTSSGAPVVSSSKKFGG